MKTSSFLSFSHSTFVGFACAFLVVVFGCLWFAAQTQSTGRNSGPNQAPRINVQSPHAASESSGVQTGPPTVHRRQEVFSQKTTTELARLPNPQIPKSDEHRPDPNKQRATRFANDPSPADSLDQHGSATAGVAAAIGQYGLGVTGTAYNCKIKPKRREQEEFVLDAAGSSSSHPSIIRSRHDSRGLLASSDHFDGY